MATTTEPLPSSNDELTSPSNAIDEMISMSVIDHLEPNNENATARKTASPRFVYLIRSIKIIFIMKNILF